MGLNDSPNHIQLVGAETVITGQAERVEPELAGLVLAFHMKVRWLVAVKTGEKGPIRPGNTLDSRHSELSPF